MGQSREVTRKGQVVHHLIFCFFISRLVLSLNTITNSYIWRVIKFYLLTYVLTYLLECLISERVHRQKNS